MINRFELRDGKVVLVRPMSDGPVLPEALQSAVRAPAGRVTYMANESLSPATSFKVGNPLPISHVGPLTAALQFFQDEILVESAPTAEGPLALVALCGTGAECWSWITTPGPKPAVERVITSAKATLAVVNTLAALTDGMQGIKPTLTVLGFLVKVGEETFVYLRDREREPAP